MNGILKRIKTNAILSDTLYVLFGFLLLLRPELSSAVLCTALGIILVLRGSCDILNFLFHRKDGSLYYSLHLVFGIVLSAIGVWLIAQPNLIAVLIPRIVGLLILFHGFSSLGAAWKLHQNKSPRFAAALLISCITIAFGALLVYNPFSSFTTVIRIIGAVLVYDGLSDIWITAELSHAIKLKEKQLQELPAETNEPSEENPFTE